MSLSVCMIGLYLFNYFAMAIVGNLSWGSAKSMNFVMFDAVGVNEGWLLFGVPSTHRMSGLSLVMHIQTTILEW